MNDENLDAGAGPSGLKRELRTSVKPPSRLCTNNPLKFTVKWSEKEKEQLLRALKTHGEDNLELISAEIPTKQVQQVKSFIGYLKGKSKDLMGYQTKFRLRDKMANLKDWIKLIKDRTSQTELDTNLPLLTSILAIAHLEEFPTCDNPESIDFKTAYQFLYHLLSGNEELVLNVDQATRDFVLESLTMVAKTVDTHVIPLVDVLNGEAENLKSFKKSARLKEEQLSDVKIIPMDLRPMMESPLLNPLFFQLHATEINKDVLNHYIKEI